MHIFTAVCGYAETKVYNSCQQEAMQVQLNLLSKKDLMRKKSLLICVTAAEADA